MHLAIIKSQSVASVENGLTRARKKVQINIFLNVFARLIAIARIVAQR